MNRVFDHVSRGLLLITLGVIFLLLNYGYLSWRLWLQVIDLWPLILVLVGTGLLFNRRIPFSTILLIFILSMIGYSLVMRDKPMPEHIFNRLENSQSGHPDVYLPREFDEEY